MIRALLVDDEDAANRWLADLLSDFPSVEVVGAVTSVARAESLIAELPVDVVFLDIEMPRRQGFELFAQLDPMIRVVMVTAHDDRALRAYEFGAVDYLLKPVSPDRLRVTLERLTTQLAEQAASPTVAPSTQIPVATSGGLAMLDLDGVLWIEARENYSLVHRVDQPPLLIKRTLNEWEQKLPDRSFARIDRSTILNLTRIASAQWRQPDDRTLWLKGANRSLPLGRAAATRLRRLLALRRDD